MSHLAGTAGDVFVANLLLEDCEDAWNSGTNGTAALESTLVKVGAGSAKTTIGAGIQVGDVIAYETMSEVKNVSTYSHILCWAYSSVNTASDDYRIGLGTTAEGASPTTLVTVPALTAVTWKYCHCVEVTGSEMADTSAGTIIGLESNANGANADIIYLDDIRAAKLIAGIRSWNLDYTADTLDVTDFGSSGIKEYIIAGYGWAGSFEGYKDGAPLTIGSEYGLELAESATSTQMWLGNAFITAVHPTVDINGVIAYSYDFIGTGTLTIASA